MVNIYPLTALHCWDSRVANSSYNEYTKSSLKIYQIDTKFFCNKNLKFNAGFPHFFMTSLNDHTVAVKQCHHREAASSISTFLSDNRFISPWKVQPSNTCKCISFLLWSTAFLCYVIQTLSEILLCKPCKLYHSLFYKSYATFIRSTVGIGSGFSGRVRVRVGFGSGSGRVRANNFYIFRAEFGFIFCSSRNVLRISLEEIGKSGQNRVLFHLSGSGRVSDNRDRVRVGLWCTARSWCTARNICFNKSFKRNCIISSSTGIPNLGV